MLLPETFSFIDIWIDTTQSLLNAHRLTDQPPNTSNPPLLAPTSSNPRLPSRKPSLTPTRHNPERACKRAKTMVSTRASRNQEPDQHAPHDAQPNIQTRGGGQGRRGVQERGRGRGRPRASATGHPIHQLSGPSQAAETGSIHYVRQRTTNLSLQSETGTAIGQAAFPHHSITQGTAQHPPTSLDRQPTQPREHINPNFLPSILDRAPTEPSVVFNPTSETASTGHSLHSRTARPRSPRKRGTTTLDKDKPDSAITMTDLESCEPPVRLRNRKELYTRNQVPEMVSDLDKLLSRRRAGFIPAALKVASSPGNRTCHSSVN